MSGSFINHTSRVAIAGRVAEHRRPLCWNDLTLRGDYHPPFGKIEARAEAALSGFVSSNHPAMPRACALVMTVTAIRLQMTKLFV